MGQLGQKISVRDSATTLDINGTLTSLAFTSEPIEVLGKDWSLNTWHTAALIGVPTFTIEVSNVTDTGSFNPLGCAENLPTEKPFIYNSSEYKYMRIVYLDNGATGGNKNFDLIVL